MGGYAAAERISRRRLVISAAALMSVLVLSACDDQADRAVSLTGGDPARGAEAIRSKGCGSCHEIPGIRGAQGRVGPPLFAVSRQAYIAGILPNTPENLILWLQNPPAVSPKTAMPNMAVSPPAARDIAAYLYTLRGG